MCDEHHLQRHQDLFSVRQDPEVGFRFFRADGTELTGAPGEVAAIERSHERPAVPVADSAPAPDPASEQLEEDAARALVVLGLRPRDGAGVVSSAREALVARGEAVTLESLVREGLSAFGRPERRDRKGEPRGS